MFSLGPKFDAFIEHPPAAVAVRAVLQRLLPAERLNQLFNDTAEEQYEKKLLFSTIMNLMLHVTRKSSPSLRQTYLAHRHEIPATLSAVYQKVNNLEPKLYAELVRYSAKRTRPVLESIDARREALVKGFRTLIVDGNHFSGTHHRLVGTREDQAAPLPGFAIAVYDPQCEMVVDMIPRDDGHTQERALLGELAGLVKPNDLRVADRNFCTTDFLFSIHRRQAYFLMAQHEITGECGIVRVCVGGFVVQCGIAGSRDAVLCSRREVCGTKTVVASSLRGDIECLAWDGGGDPVA